MLCAAAHLLGQQLMAALLIGGGRQLIRQLLQRVEAAVPGVLLQVIVGVHQVDERPQTLSHAAQRRGPYVVPAGKNLAQQRAEGVAQRVQIVAARALQHIELVEHRSDFAHLAGPALA